MAAAVAVPAMMEGVEEGQQQQHYEQQQQHHQQQHHQQQQQQQQQSTSESSTDQVDAPPFLASFDHVEVPKPAAPAKDEEDVTCATIADAIATVAAVTGDCAAEEEEHGRVVDIGNSSNDRPEPPPVIPSSEEVTISMMLDESDRDLIAARLTRCHLVFSIALAVSGWY